MNEAEKRTQRDLQGFLAEQIAANADRLAPELISYAGGTTREEISASVQALVRKSSELVQRAVQGQFRASGHPDPGPGVTANMQGFGDPQPLTAEAVAGLSMDDYAKLRAQLGIGQNQQHGILAPIKNG